ncbi:MAG TPA: PAS domain S-box protein [Casimicrobiaceae bacterium]|nr:PAS domain S-box protein [Casimicrobiaceae bacterium]
MKASATAMRLVSSRDEGSEQSYRQMVKRLPAAVYTTDAEGRIDLYNDAAVALWGRTPAVGADRWCGSHRIYHPDGAPMPLGSCPMAIALRERRPVRNVEIVVERPDGTRRNVLPHPEPILDADGKLIGGMNMLVDITERKRSEAELAATRDRLAWQVHALTRLHELATHLAGTTDCTTALQMIVETLVELHDADFGMLSTYDPSTRELRKVASIGLDEPALSVLGRVAPGPQSGAGGTAFATRMRAMVEDVETDPTFIGLREVARSSGIRAAHCTPIITRTGEIVGVLSVYFRRTRKPSELEMQLADMCAGQAAERIDSERHRLALRATEQLSHTIGESMDYGVWICDAAGRNTYASESFLKLIGLGQEQYSGSEWDAIVHPDDAGEALAAWRECLRSGANWDREYRVRGADGAWHPVLSRGQPVRDEHGDITAWAGIHLDIGRLKKVESELREADQRKDEFLAMLAHELRNPLAPLCTGLEVLRLTPDVAVGEQARAMMDRQLRQMVRLIDDLLDVSRISRGKIELRRERIDLNGVVTHAVESSRPMLHSMQHQLSVALSREPILVEVDAARMAQVFGNLLNNAAKYTEPGGHIVVRVEREQEQVAVSVIDDGVGIPPAMLDKVFDLFVQVDPSLERTHGGLGIGLTLVKRLVEMHGGSVEARSAGERRGSAFTVRLPIVAADRQDDEQTSRSGASQASDGACRILVVDDNRDAATTLSMLLELMGHQVQIAHNGSEALACAQSFLPHAMLLDIGMPGLNGYDVCRHVRRQPWGRDMMVIALTGWGQQADYRRSRQAGFDEHLVKPVAPDVLREVVTRVRAFAAAHV